MLPKLVPVTDIKRKATEIIAALQHDQKTLVITQHGREAAVLMDVTSYRMQQGKLALLEGIIRGQQALAEGRTRSHKDVMAQTAKWA